MADISITAANVVADSTASHVNGTAGETLAAGKAVYKSSTTQKWMLADSNSATVEARKATGIALCGSALNQPVTVLTSGLVTIGATLTAGLAYYLSDTPGGICLVADVGSGEFVCLLGFATSAAILNVGIEFPNVSL
jgi:hypothetical protein